MSSGDRWDRRIKIASWAWFLAALAVAAYVFASADRRSVVTEVATHTVQSKQTRSVQSPPKSVTRNIEDIHVGQRVIADNPMPSDVDLEPEPNKESWCQVEIGVTRDDGYQLDITLLRPFEWLAEYGAVPGQAIELDIPEMN